MEKKKSKQLQVSSLYKYMYRDKESQADTWHRWITDKCGTDKVWRGT